MSSPFEPPSIFRVALSPVAGLGACGCAQAALPLSLVSAVVPAGQRQRQLDQATFWSPFQKGFEPENLLLANSRLIRR